jgi:hypothetical protein
MSKEPGITPRIGELMKKLRTDWFTFQPSEDEVTVHNRYSLAVRDAQYRGCTESRPQRLRAGHYRLWGCSGHEYWIVSHSVMQKNFLQLMELAYEDAA